jgi:hypothetical protein
MTTTTRAAPPLDLHVTLRWRDDVLVVRHVQGDGVAAVGAHPDALADIPCAPAFARGFVLARLDRGAATAVAPDGSMATVRRAGGRVDLVEGPAAVALDAGDAAELSLGDFRITAVADAPVALPRGPRRMAGAWGAVAVAALAHAVGLGLSAQEALASSAEDREDGRADLIKGMLASAELRARAEVTPREDGAGEGEGQRTNDERGDGRPGGGAKARGDDGAMGDALGRGDAHRRYAVPALVKKDPEPSAARHEALADASQFGMIGLLAQGPRVPSASFADEEAHGTDALAADGAMWARVLGASGGAGGLGLSGIGEAAGGRGEGIGLGTVGTLGHGSGAVGPGTGGEGSRAAGGGAWSSWDGFSSRVRGSHRVGRIYACGYDSVSISGRLPPETIQRIVRQNFGRFRACYEDGLRASPNLAGRVTVRFVIGRDGAVSSAADGGSDLSPGVNSCVVRAFYGLSFPQPEGGVVTVTYPISFSPG